MRIEFKRGYSAFRPENIIARGCVAHEDSEACAIVIISHDVAAHLADAKVEEFARPLLIKEFAQGHWHWFPSKGDECHVVSGKWEKTREPITVTI